MDLGKSRWCEFCPLALLRAAWHLAFLNSQFVVEDNVPMSSELLDYGTYLGIVQGIQVVVP